MEPVITGREPHPILHDIANPDQWSGFASHRSAEYGLADFWMSARIPHKRLFSTLLGGLGHEA